MKKFSQIVLLVCVVGALGLLGALTLLRGIKAPKDYDIYENRSLAKAPDCAAASVWSGRFSSGLEAFLSDQLPGRTKIFRTDVLLRQRLGLPSVNGVVTADGVLLRDNGYYDASALDRAAAAAKIADGLRAVRAAAEENGSALLYVSVPTQRSFFAGYYPSYMNNDLSRDAAETQALYSALGAAQIPYLELRRDVDAGAEVKSEFYYTVDHHFTLRGAAAGLEEIYRVLSERYGMRLSLPADLTFYELDRPFLGTYNRKLYDLSPVSDKLWLCETDGFPVFTRSDDGILTAPQVFSVPDSGPVSYSVYMGGDFGETVLKTDRPDLPDLLIVGDSFTNAMETLAWLSFDETRSLDYRYYDGAALSDYIRAYQPDVVLIVRDTSVCLNTDGNGGLK